jgi:DNA-binding MarR family transcriptional regulator
VGDVAHMPERPPSDALEPLYLETAWLVARASRRLHEAIEYKLERANHPEVRAAEALLLYRIGDNQPTARELHTRAYFLGSNVSYNMKKLGDLALLEWERRSDDKRLVRIKVTPAGREIAAIVAAAYAKHARFLAAAGMDVAELAALNHTLARLERFWTEQVLYRL